MDCYKKLFNKKNVLIYLALFIYIFINVKYLTQFPFVHSDESWLSGLSRNIAEKGSFSVTETFFDLKIRHPHAIKIIFHSLQILFIKIFGYSIFSVRLISLIFGIFVLYYQYKLCKTIFNSERVSLVGVLFLAVDVQFIYASHFARQEIILLFILIFALNFFLKNMSHHKFRHDITLGIIIGLGIGIHPNSFIISLPFGFIYLYHIIITKKLKIKNIILYIIVLSVFAAFFVGLSLHFDPNFISNYSKYGNEFDVFDPIISKFAEVKDFYLKLFYEVSGTYYTPNIRLEFFIFPIALLASLLLIHNSKSNFEKETILSIIISIAAINAGIIFIGRYNQTSIAFQFPLFYILIMYLLNKIKGSYKKIAALCLAFFICCNTLYNILPYINSSYNDYLYEISKVVNKRDTVLANLNAEYYFDNGRLYDYRNLAFLKDSNMTFKDYIENNKIQYIIYPEEMDLIYNLRPKWNGIYGNLLYYKDMQNFLNNNCEMVYEFTSKTYGIRIAQYINTKDWKVKIYKVNEHFK